MREEVGVIAGQADHGEHLARPRIDHHRGACGLAVARESRGERRRGRPLEARVERQIDGAARDRRQRGQHLPDLAARVDLDVGPSVLAAERRFETRLDANLADQLVGLVPEQLQSIRLRGIDRPDVADHVAEDQRIAVRPDRALDDGDTRQLGQTLVDRKVVRLGEVCHDGHRGEGVGRQQLSRELFFRDSRDSRQLDELLRAFPRIRRYARGHHCEAPHRAVLHQGRGVAVVDDAAVRLQHDAAHRVGLGKGRESRTVRHLQLRELDRQDADHEHGKGPGGGQAERPPRPGFGPAELK